MNIFEITKLPFFHQNAIPREEITSKHSSFHWPEATIGVGRTLKILNGLTFSLNPQCFCQLPSFQSTAIDILIIHRRGKPRLSRISKF